MRWMVNRAIDAVGPVQPLETELERAASDELVTLWVEDVCWQVQLVAWQMRRPPWWRRSDRRAWRTQRQVLDAAGQRLRQVAWERCGHRGHDSSDGGADLGQGDW